MIGDVLVRIVYMLTSRAFAWLVLLVAVIEHVSTRVRILGATADSDEGCHDVRETGGDPELGHLVDEKLADRSSPGALPVARCPLNQSHDACAAPSQARTGEGSASRSTLPPAPMGGTGRPDSAALPRPVSRSAQAATAAALSTAVAAKP